MEVVEKIKDLEIQKVKENSFYVLYKNNECGDTVCGRVDTLRRAKNLFNKTAKLAGYIN